jgi:N-acyl-D-amino-acid deacylase
MYPLDDALSYEPAAADSVQGIVEATGRHHLDVLMDALAERRPIITFAGGYPGDLSPQFDVIADERSVFGLSDGGAHCGVLCDASVPTYMLSYVARDRIRGDTLPLELVVHKMTQDSARVYGLLDRGVIVPGYRADLNLIDYDALALEQPEMVYDLPSQGKRLIQKARGYVATIVRGKVTFENGEATGDIREGCCAQARLQETTADRVPLGRLRSLRHARAASGRRPRVAGLCSPDVASARLIRISGTRAGVFPRYQPP